MDVNMLNPFVESFNNVMPQLGFSEIKTFEWTKKEKEVIGNGAVIILGIVGAVRGNVVYSIDIDSSKQIASTMMMGMPIEELDDMAKSALSELTNMLTANAATVFSDNGIIIDISTPTMTIGNSISINMSSKEIFSTRLSADDISMEINVAFEG